MRARVVDQLFITPSMIFEFYEPPELLLVNFDLQTLSRRVISGREPRKPVGFIIIVHSGGLQVQRKVIKYYE